MADVEDEGSSRFDDIDLESILSRVERRGPLTFTKRRCLYRAPEFVQRLSGEETVEEGTTVKFSCKVMAFPKPTLTLYKDGVKIEDNPRITIEQREHGEYILIIKKIRKKDEALYRCKAENAEGSTASTLYVQVKVKAKSKVTKKSPNRKYLKNFPPITERQSEEEREEEDVKFQPDSPLTYLYNGVTRKSRTWPEFLGSWAFANEINAEDFDDLNYIDNDGDDVFLSDDNSINDNISDDDFDDDSYCMSPPESEGYYSDNQTYESDLPESLGGGIAIPNLVFENKNIVRSKGHEDLSSFTTDRPLTLKMDENANKKIIKTGHNNSYNYSSNNRALVFKKCGMFSNKPCSESDVLRKRFHQESCDSMDCYLLREFEQIHSDCDVCNEGAHWTEIVLLVTFTTLLALMFNWYPSTLVLFVLICELLYLIIQILLNIV